MIIVQDLVSGTFYLWRKGSFLWKQRHLTNILFLYAWVKTRPVFNKSVRLVIKLQLRFECSCKCYLLAVRGPAHKYPSFLSFFFFFSFCPPVTRPGEKIITEIRWFRYSCERIESEYFTNTMTSQHIISSGIRMFHCHFAFLRIVTYLKFSISGWLFKLIIKSKPD